MAVARGVATGRMGESGSDGIGIAARMGAAAAVATGAGVAANAIGACAGGGAGIA